MGRRLEDAGAAVDNTWVAQATFSQPGTYVLRCIAHDGGLTTHEDITFIVTE